MASSLIRRLVAAGLRGRSLGGYATQLLIFATSSGTIGTQATSAATLRVPSDYPTIQSAIQAAAPDDTILVAPGIYDENLDTLGKWLTLIGEAGPEATIVDGGGRASVLRLSGGGVVEGFTLRRGRSPNRGGGLWIYGQPGTVIRNNIIEGNIAGYPDFGSGGGIFVEYSSPEGSVLVESNQIRNNYAGDSGGGIYDFGTYNEVRENVISGNGCHVCGGGIWLGGSIFVRNLVLGNWSDSFAGGVCGGGAEIRNNTVVENFTHNFPASAGIHIFDGRPLIANNIVANNVGIGIQCFTGFPIHPRLECNDSWGNAGGDYLIHASCDTTGGRNFSADPLFCDEEHGDFRISDQSPCSPSGSPGCGLIGAFPVGCGTTAIQPATWGRIKATYR